MSSASVSLAQTARQRPRVTKRVGLFEGTGLHATQNYIVIIAEGPAGCTQMVLSLNKGVPI